MILSDKYSEKKLLKSEDLSISPLFKKKILITPILHINAQMDREKHRITLPLINLHK